jgi:hypothetical protein
MNDAEADFTIEGRRKESGNPAGKPTETEANANQEPESGKKAFASVKANAPSTLPPMISLR